MLMVNLLLYKGIIKLMATENTAPSKFDILQNIKNKNGNLMNIPYSYNHNADPGDRVFNKTILKDGFILNIAPGEPKFSIEHQAIDSPDSEKKTLFQSFMNYVNNAKDSASFTDDFLKSIDTYKDFRYYSFKYNWSLYLQYVQQMSFYVWQRMGLGSGQYTYHASEEITKDFGGDSEKGILPGILSGSHMSLGFFCDYNGTSITEDGDNTFTSSKLEEVVKTGSGYMKEARFLLGLDVNANTEATEGGALGKMTSLLTTVAHKLSGAVGAPQIGEALDTVLSGTQMMFPQVWNDSNFSRSCSISIKLHSPYGTPDEIFKRIYLPLICLFALTLPRQSGMIDYMPPFLVRVDVPGWFRINCGVITSLTIKKGGDSNLWTSSGLPMQLDIGMSIQDMYPALMISKNHLELGYNIGLMDFLDNMCGLEVGKVDLEQSISYYIKNKLNIFGNVADRIRGNIADFKGNSRYGVTQWVSRFFGA